MLNRKKQHVVVVEEVAIVKAFARRKKSINLSMKSYKIFIFLLVICEFEESVIAQENENKSVTLGASYIGDILNNVSGGIKTGTNYLGFVDFNLNLNTKNCKLWKGGELMIDIANTHGKTPSEDLIGDFQVVSNIEAGNHTFLYQLWYNQHFLDFDVTIGLQDLNADFANSNSAALFLNSSFGIPSTFAINMDTPLFPLTAQGITLQWHASDKLNIKEAYYKGCITDFDNNKYNLKCNLNHLHGMLNIFEAEYSINNYDLKGGYFFHKSHPVCNSDWNKTHGFYFIGDKTFCLPDAVSSLNCFLQISYSPHSNNPAYYGFGCTYTNIFSKKKNDALGLAMATGIQEDKIGPDESSLELTYQYNLNDHAFLQPDVQYVINPGSEESLNNALVGTLRFGLDF